MGCVQALHGRASKGAPRGLRIKLFAEVCKYMNFSGGAFCKLHLPTEITGGLCGSIKNGVLCFPGSGVSHGLSSF